MARFAVQRLIVVLFLAVLGSGLALADNQTRPTESSDTQAAQIPLVERIKIATAIHDAVTTYFAHWQAIPNEDFDADFDRYIQTISQTGQRRAFDMATLALFAHLHNGHTGFGDAWLNQHSGHRPGLSVAHRNGHWIVERSSRPGIAPGQIITAIDDTPIDAFYADKKRYIAASSERQRSRQMFARAYLFPRRFTLHLANGDSQTIDRSKPAKQAIKKAKTDSQINWPAGVYYHRIPSFEQPDGEAQAIAFIKKHRDAKALVLDVRGNGGGITPNKLVNALLLKPYLGMGQASAMSVGLLAAYGKLAGSPMLKDYPRMDAMADAMHEYFDRPMLYWPGHLQKPDHPIYRGQLIVLADIGCASSCEDLLVPLKESHRATIIGDTTYGSTGQPFIQQFDNGMGFRVSAKREFFGDGRPFEGVGIKPDIRIVPSAADLRAGRDPVLAKARALAGSSSTDQAAP